MFIVYRVLVIIAFIGWETRYHLVSFSQYPYEEAEAQKVKLVTNSPFGLGLELQVG